MRIGADRRPRRRLRGGETISGDLPLHLDVGSSRRGSPMDRSTTSRRRRDARFCLLQRRRSGEGLLVTEDPRLGHWLWLEPLSIRPCAKPSSSRSYTSCSSLLRASSPGFSKAKLWQPVSRQSAADSRAARRPLGLLCRAHAVFRLPPCQSRARTWPFVHHCRELSPKLHSH
jgi:hypothetical protein